MPVFVAVFPPDAIKAVLRSIARRAEGVDWVSDDHWHITLRFLGDAPAEAVAERLSDLQPAPARAVLGPTTTAPWGPRNLVLPVTGLDPLAAQLATATADIGHPPDDSFFGHLGLARSDASVERLVGIEVDAAFDVTELTLVDSDWSTFPPRYTKVAAFAVGSEVSRG